MRSKKQSLIGLLIVVSMALNTVTSTSAFELGGGQGPTRDPDPVPTSRATPDELIAELKDDVSAIDLKHKKEKKLNKILDKALDKHEDGKICKTVKKLNKFIEKVGKYVDKGTLTLIEGASLIASANVIISLLGDVDCDHHHDKDHHEEH